MTSPEKPLEMTSPEKPLEMTSPEKPPVRIKPKRLCKFDEKTYNNKLVWGNLDESPDGRERYQFSGTVVRITDHGVVLFVPISGVRKVFVESNLIRDSPFLKENGGLKLGQWMSVECEKRSPKESDFLRKPSMSHIAVSKPTFFPVEEYLKGWQQRSHAGVFEFLMTADLTKKNTVQHYNIGSKKIYCVVTEFNLEVLVPCYRLNPFISTISLTGDRRVRFWATRANTDDDRFFLHLVDYNPLEEILPNGEIVFLGSGRRAAPTVEHKKGKKNEDVTVDTTPRSSSASSGTLTPSTGSKNATESDEKERKNEEKKRRNEENSPPIPKETSPGIESSEVTTTQPTLPEVLEALAVLNTPELRKVIEEEGLLPEQQVLMEWAKELEAGRASYHDL